MADQTLQRRLAPALIIAAAIRLALAPFFHGYGFDVLTWRNWSGVLERYPLNEFYQHARSADHLPGDLWLLWLVAHAYRLFYDDAFHHPLFLLLAKLPPIAADLVAGIALYAIVAPKRGGRLGVATMYAYLFNPAMIFLSSAWGQWDAVSLALSLSATALLRRPSRARVLAPALIAWAVLIKPQMVLLAPYQALLFFDAPGVPWRIRVRERISQAVGSVVIAAAVAIALTRPFGVGIPPIRADFSLTSRISYALDIWPYTTMGAANFWMIPIGSLHRHSDTRHQFLHLSLHAWGTAGFIAIYALIAVIGWWRLRRFGADIAIFWCMFAAAFAFFMLPTRVHERYLLPAVTLAILLAGYSGGSRAVSVIAGITSSTFLVNLLAVYWSGWGPLFSIVAVVNGGAFLATLALPFFGAIWQNGNSPYPLPASDGLAATG